MRYIIVSVVLVFAIAAVSGGEGRSAYAGCGGSAPEAAAGCSGAAHANLFATPVRSGFAKLKANREAVRASRSAAKLSCSGAPAVKASCSGS